MRAIPSGILLALALSACGGGEVRSSTPDESGDFDACSQSSVGLIEIARAYREALDWTTDAALAIA